LLTLADMTASGEDSLAAVNAAWHGVFWLVFANAVGVMLAVLLLLPALNPILGELTYGRWMMVHMNIMLYGWTSLPLAGFLFKVYGADRGALARWCRPVLWAWSAALAVGIFSWLSGNSSGKLFLDWSGYARVFFPVALTALWVLLLLALVRSRDHEENAPFVTKAAKLGGLLVLVIIPFLLYRAAGPDFYPPVNPDSGGPTGASQLESSLGIVAVMLVLPFGLARRKHGISRILFTAWLVLLAESLLCVLLGRSDISHRIPAQYLSLSTLLVWLPLTPAYYAAFAWHPATRLWRTAFLWWWAALIVTGWIFFLPGVLDHFKFTDGLVGHSFVAMAGFTSSLIIFASIQLMGAHGWIFNRARSFYAWNLSVIAYIVLMTVAGWREGFDPTFTIVPGLARNLLYLLRLVTGVVMLLASVDWLVDATSVLRRQGSELINQSQERAA